MLTTLRSHDQYNTTIYSLGDRYRGVFGRRDVLFMNEDDMRECHIEHGDVVDIISLVPAAATLRLAGITAIAYDISRGSVGAYYPEANCLLPLGHGDERSGTPAYKSIPVRVVAAA
jgi:anaerobic selenocysteine-containing dehydrogenase